MIDRMFLHSLHTRYILCFWGSRDIPCGTDNIPHTGAMPVALSPWHHEAVVAFGWTRLGFEHVGEPLLGLGEVRVCLCPKGETE